MLYISESDTAAMDLSMADIVPFVESVLMKPLNASPRLRLVDPPIGSNKDAGKGRPWDRDLRITPGFIEGLGFAVRLGASRMGVSPSRTANGGALLILFDWESMAPKAAISDWIVHAIRSTTPDGIAARHLALPDADTIALIGSGRLARWAAEAVMAVRPIKHVRVFSPNREHREECARYLAARNPDVRSLAVDHPRAACEDAQVVIGAASSREPLIDGHWLAPGALAISNEPEDYDETTIERGRLFTTWLPGVVSHVPRYEGVDRVLERTNRSIEDAVVDISAVVDGSAPGRLSTDETLIFLNPAFPVFDVALAAYVYDKAVELGLGTRLDRPVLSARSPNWAEAGL